MKMTAIVAFCLIFQSINSSANSNSVHSDSPESILSLKMIESGLSPGAQHLLGRNVFVNKNWRDLTVADICRTKAEYILGRAPEAEITELLGRFGLHLSMTSHEVDFYRKNGRLPEGLEGVSGETDVESILLSGRATRALLREGIKRLSDHRKISLEELLLVPNTGPTTVREIEVAFKDAGFPMYGTRGERCQALLNLSTPASTKQ